MKIPLSWLKEYINIKLSPQELAHRLTMAGVEVSHIQKSGKDTILELDLTTNRGDCASIIGVAREVSALINRPLRPPGISEKDKKQKGIICFQERRVPNRALTLSLLKVILFAFLGRRFLSMN
ncbi:unnamed protein product, partial [marine sediment metagenome]